jgi:hypothetical protein
MEVCRSRCRGCYCRGLPLDPLGRGCAVISPETLAVGLARVGQSDERVVFGPIADLVTVDFGAPLHSLVILGELHDMELEYLRKSFAVTADTARLPPPKEEPDSSSSSDSDRD